MKGELMIYPRCGIVHNSHCFSRSPARKVRSPDTEGIAGYAPLWCRDPVLSTLVQSIARQRVTAVCSMALVHASYTLRRNLVAVYCSYIGQPVVCKPNLQTAVCNARRPTCLVQTQSANQI